MLSSTSGSSDPVFGVLSPVGMPIDLGAGVGQWPSIGAFIWPMTLVKFLHSIVVWPESWWYSQYFAFSRYAVVSIHIGSTPGSALAPFSVGRLSFHFEWVPLASGVLRMGPFPCSRVYTP